MIQRRAIPGFEGQYEITDDGTVCGVDRIDCGGRKWPGKVLAQRRDKDGYLRVALTKNGRTKVFMVHRLVLEAFVGPPSNGQVACHGDGSRDDNAVANLRWGSLEDNWADAKKHGTRIAGATNPSAKINAIDIERVLDLRAAGQTHKEIAEWVGISGASVSNICNGMHRFANANQSHVLN